VNLIVLSSERRTVVPGDVVQDATRFALFLISAPVVVVTSGVVIGLVGRWITGHRGGRRAGR